MKLGFALAILPLLFTQSLMAQSGAAAKPVLDQVGAWSGFYGSYYVEKTGEEFDFGSNVYWSDEELDSMTLDFSVVDKVLNYEWDRPGLNPNNPLETDDKSCAKNENGVDKFLTRQVIFVDELLGAAAQFKEGANKFKEAGLDANAEAYGQKAAEYQAQAEGIKAAKQKLNLKQEVIALIRGEVCRGGEKLKELQVPVIEVEITEVNNVKELRMVAVLDLATDKEKEGYLFFDKDIMSKDLMRYSTYTMRPAK